MTGTVPVRGVCVGAHAEVFFLSAEQGCHHRLSATKIWVKLRKELQKEDSRELRSVPGWFGARERLLAFVTFSSRHIIVCVLALTPD